MLSYEPFVNHIIVKFYSSFAETCHDAQIPLQDDAIKLKYFQRYWPFVMGIHWSPVDPSQRPVTQSFEVFFDLRLNKRLSKQSRRWRFETLSHPLWRHCNGNPACVDFSSVCINPSICLFDDRVDSVGFIFFLYFEKLQIDIMMTSSYGKKSALRALCAGNSPVTGEFPSQRPVTQSFDVFVDLRRLKMHSFMICLIVLPLLIHAYKRLSKQSRRWRFETLSRPSWRHCNGNASGVALSSVCTNQLIRLFDNRVDIMGFISCLYFEKNLIDTELSLD